MKILLVLGLISLILLGGCQNAYESCKEDCVRICNKEQCNLGRCPTMSEGLKVTSECKDDCSVICR